ncbi:DUF2188 domain-containing protein [Nocardia brasiliensis]
MAKGDIETYYEDGIWKNRPEGNSRASNTHDTKAAATEEGREMAIKRDVEHLIKRKDGQIQEKNTYPRSRDKNPPRG